MADNEAVKYNKMNDDLRRRIVKSINEGHASISSAAKHFKYEISLVRLDHLQRNKVKVINE